MSKPRLPVSSSEAPALIAGESFIINGSVDNILLLDPNLKPIAEGGRIWVTNFRTFLRFYETGEENITHGSVHKIERSNSPTHEILSIFCRTPSLKILGIPLTSKSRKEVSKAIVKCAYPRSEKRLFCFSHPPTTYRNPGWDIFNLETEFKRQGLNLSNWRISVANVCYDVCRSYPTQLMVPQQISEDSIFSCAQFRTRGLVPALTWGNSQNCLIFRCSQLNPAEDGLNGLAAIQKSSQDELYMKVVLNISGKDRLNIVDLASQDTHSEQTYKGFFQDNCTFWYLNLPNEVLIREAMRNLVHMCNTVASSMNSNHSSPEELELLTQEPYIKWIDILSGFLKAANDIRNSILNDGQSFVIQSETGANVNILSALVQILVDPYYRTIDGLCLLIEKEFMYFGHKFGTFSGTSKKRDDEYSSGFFLFLSGVMEVIRQYPFSFEYTPDLLSFLIHACYSCQFGNFIGSCERERLKLELKKKTASIWGYIAQERQDFINPYFEARKDLPPIRHTKEYLRIWSSHFFQASMKNSYQSAERSLQTNASRRVLSLELSSLKLPSLPPFDWSGCLHTTSINLSGNLLTQLPLGLVALSGLKRLIAQANHIPFIPDEFVEKLTTQWTTLEELNLANNQLMTFQDAFCRLKSLKVLQLQKNQLSSIPDLSGFVNLVELQIGGNNLKEIPPEIFQMNTLQILNIAGNKVSEIPHLLSNLTNLRQLDISNVGISQLPKNFENLQELRSLNLSDNKFEGIPPVIFSFSKLERLDVSNLKIEVIPKEIESFANLNRLDLSHNKITVLPEELLKLRNLKYLHLEHNALKTIPLDISRLDQLIELHLQDNHLIALSPGVGKLSELRLLNISKNNVVHLPGTIGYLDGLRQSRQFTWKGNPLATPPSSVVASGYESVFEYLRELLNGQEKCYRMKIMLVGQENVGKTSLLRCLKNLQQSKPRGAGSAGVDKTLKDATGLDSVSTDGIDISSLNFKIKLPSDSSSDGTTTKGGRRTVELSVWDFAGQEIYYTTHQFFLTSRALYLLVWNIARHEEDSRVEYWLKSITARAPDAPIVIVGTHADHPKCTKDYVKKTIESMYNKYTPDYPNIQHIGMVSCSSGEGVLDINLYIHAIVMNQRYMGEYIPKSYLELEKLTSEEATKRLPPVVSWEHFQAMAVICNIKTDIGLTTVATWLHNLGAILYFQEQKGLEDIVILDPQWLTDVMSSIITTKHHFAKNGVLDHTNLRMIWKDHTKFPPHLHRVLLSLLEKFEISHYLKSSRRPPPSSSSSSSIQGGSGSQIQLSLSHSQSNPMVAGSHHQKSPSPLSASVPNRLQSTSTGHLQLQHSSGNVPSNPEDWIYTGRSLVPSLLPTDKPHDIDVVWSTFPSDHESQFARRYQFGFIPHGFISRLMVRLLHFAEPHIFWRNGMLVEQAHRREEEQSEHSELLDDSPTTAILKVSASSLPQDEHSKSPSNSHPKNQSPSQTHHDQDGGGGGGGGVSGENLILVEVQPAQRYLDIIIRGDSAQQRQLAQIILETVNALIDGWYSLDVEVFVPCIHCIREKNYSPYMFPLEECEQACMEGKFSLKCFGIRDIRLDELVPDITMAHVSNCKIPYSELTLAEQIGEGGYAVVYKGTYENKPVAIKKIKFNTNADAALFDDTSEIQAFAEFRREVWIMSGLLHLNIVQMAGFTMEPFCIVTEFMHYGNLYDLIHSDAQLSWPLRWRCAMDMAKGMSFLHHTTWPPVIHRDLKSPNVLMSSLDPKAETVAKVADFGLSQALASTTQGRSVANPVWLAPEIMKNEEYTEKADVYSFGVILWELVSRQDFFGDIKFLSALELNVIQGERPKIPSDCPPVLAEVIQACWAQLPEDRPPFSTIVELLAEGFKAHLPELYEIAIAEREVELIRPKVNQTDGPKKKRTIAEIEEERKSAELARKKQAADELEGISTRIQVNSSVQCLVYVSGLALGRDQPQVWAGTSEGSILAFSLSGQLLNTIAAHSSQIFSLLVVQDSIWSSSADNTIHIYNISTGKLKKEVKGSMVLCLHLVGKNVWGGSTDGNIIVYDSKAGRQKRKIKILENVPITCLLLLTSGLVWAGTDCPGKSIAIINPAKYKLLDFVANGHSKKVNAIVEEGKFIWTCSSDRSIKLWNPETCECVRLLQGHTGPIFHIHRTDSHVWSASWDKTVILWDSEYQLFYKEFEPHTDAVSSILYVPDNSSIWTGSWDKTILLWKSHP